MGRVLRIATSIVEKEADIMRTKYFDQAFVLRAVLVNGRKSVSTGPERGSWGFGLVMIEAMACGTPVVAFNPGAVPEIVEDGLTGFIIEDETSAVGAIGQLSALSRECVRARFDERFTARRMASEYLAVYRKLADAAGPQLRLASA